MREVLDACRSRLDLVGRGADALVFTGRIRDRPLSDLGPCRGTGKRERERESSTSREREREREREKRDKYSACPARENLDESRPRRAEALGDPCG